MFRKYAALAAGMLLVSALHSTLAEHAAPRLTRAQRPHVQQKGCNATSIAFVPTETDFRATSAFKSAANQGFIPTFTTTADTFPTGDAVQGHALLLSGQGAMSAESPSPGDDYTTQTLSAQEEMMANLLNQDRQRNGLSALPIDAELCRIARVKSADMRDGGYFAHESPTYGDIRAMLRQFGYTFAAAGENIAHHANVDKAQAAFMSSQGHRAAILSSAWTKVGIGIVTDANGFIYATQIFVR